MKNLVKNNESNESKERTTNLTASVKKTKVSIITKVFFAFAIMLTALTNFGFANTSNTHIRFSFKTNRPFLLEATAQKALPAGEYIVRDVEVASQHLLSIESTSDHKHIAFINAVRIADTQASKQLASQPRIVFDLEHTSGLPVFKKFFPSTATGYEIIGAVYQNRGKLIDVASIITTNNSNTRQASHVKTYLTTSPATPVKVSDNREAVALVKTTEHIN